MTAVSPGSTDDTDQEQAITVFGNRCCGPSTTDALRLYRGRRTVPKGCTAGQIFCGGVIFVVKTMITEAGDRLTDGTNLSERARSFQHLPEFGYLQDAECSVRYLTVIVSHGLSGSLLLLAQETLPSRLPDGE